MPGEAFGSATVHMSGTRQTSNRSISSARSDSNTEVTQSLFTMLMVYYDNTPRLGAMNMAIDEALLHCAMVPTIRFYRWQSPALSFGYFGRFANLAKYCVERDVVRRWTGGGTVFHGEDLTYSVVIPASDTAFDESSISIYEKIHCALAEALKQTGQPAVVIAGADRRGISGIRNPDKNCFANPVFADVMINRCKVAGAAQRRTRFGLLQQGSIQAVDSGNDLAERFAQALSKTLQEQKFQDEILNRSRELAECKYGTDAWLRRR